MRFDQTRYFLRSSVLGGKVVAELDAQGAHATNHVFAGGMELAQQTGSGTYSSLTWSHTDPLTGSSFSTDSNRTFSNKMEIDPVGQDVTNPLPPSSAPSCSPKSILCGAGNGLIEAEWGPSEEFQQANAAWAAQMDAMQVQNAIQHGYNATAQYILQKNPNVGIVVPGNSGSTTLWGEQAANFLAGGELAGTPGHETMEWQCCDNDGNPYPVPTAYSGIDAVSATAASLAISIQARPRKPPWNFFATRARHMATTLRENR